jgi:hypothetical protein
MKREIELKELAAYLPYGLKMTRNGFVGELLTLEKHSQFIVSCSDWRESTKDKNPYKPILRPLCALTEEIEHEGETFVPMDKLSFKSRKLLSNEISVYPNAQNGIEYLSYKDMCLLLEWKFDIFGLIKDNLAVPVTKEFNPYK